MNAPAPGFIDSAADCLKTLIEATTKEKLVDMSQQKTEEDSYLKESWWKR